jgi:nicotinate phosphoribosyltransferase
MNILKVDFYELTMVAGYFHCGFRGKRITCEMFVRNLPLRRKFLIAAGLAHFIQYLEEMRFSEEDIKYLSQVPGLKEAMTQEFKDYLRRFRFRGDVWAVPEGTVVFENEPLVRISADIIEAQIVETFLLSVINHSTKIASKAGRVCLAASPKAVIEFGSRRTHPDAAVDTARAAFIGGCIGTSNVEAGRRYGLPIYGTAAHMWTMAHEFEREAFKNYVQVFPHSSILLIDTYNTPEGAKRAAEIAGERLKGVRIDSGDLLETSKLVRSILNKYGLHQVLIIASDDLNEDRILELVKNKAPIDIFGVGTEIACSKDAPSLGGVYKAVFDHSKSRPLAKFSSKKVTYPGIKQIFRYMKDGFFDHDILGLEQESHPEAIPLLEPVILKGKRITPSVSLKEIQKKAKDNLSHLKQELKTIDDRGARYPVKPSKELCRLLEEVKLREQRA